MKRRSIISVVTALFVLSVIVSGIALMTTSCTGPEAVLNVYNWGQYISDGSEDSLDVNEEFEKWYLETYGVKIEVNYATFASNEDMYAKLKSGAVNYDVIIPSDYMIEQLIAEDMLEKLDFDNIPNFSYIAEDYKVGEYDPDGLYSVPYTYGMVGIIYNSTIVNGTPDSWDIMWDETYAGQILNFNNPRDAFGVAMYKLGIDVNTTEKVLWEAALSSLKEQKPLIQAYVMDEIFNKMKNGSAVIAPYYAGDFFTMYADNENLSFYYPKEGTNVFVDAMCVPKGSQNKELAEAYINFMLREDIAVANAEYICYASPNTLVRENADYKAYLEELHPDAYEILYPETIEGSETLETSYYKHLDDTTRQLMNDCWEKLKGDSSVGVGVYIICAVLIVIIAVAVIVIIVRRKKRQNYDDLYDDDDDEDGKGNEESDKPVTGTIVDKGTDCEDDPKKK